MAPTRQLIALIQTLRAQWLPLHDLRQLQDRLLREMVLYAEAHVPYYRRVFREAGLVPGTFEGLDDLARLPFLEKADLRRAFPQEILSDEFPLSACHVERTSGSSGMQLTLAADPACSDWRDASYGRALFSVGYRPWELIAVLWPETFHRQGLHERLGLMRKVWIPSHLPPRPQMEMLQRLQAPILYNFPSTLAMMAREADRFPDVRPRMILSHAELLTEASRDLIEAAFGCPVYNHYGSSEFHRMAWECSHRQGMHLDEDMMVFEILVDGRPALPGESGEVVVTGLRNHAMPLIRYRIGDMAVATDRLCPCGRGLALVERIEGRQDDFITLPSGRVIGPRMVLPMVEYVPGFQEFRVIQEQRGLFRVIIVPSEGYGPAIHDQLRRGLLELFGEDVEVRVERVDSIPKNERGKPHVVMSRVGR